MKALPMDLGVCGVEQLMYIGTVNYNTEGVGTGVTLATLPANIVVTGGAAVVNTAFNAGTTNVLTIGTNDDVNNIMGSDDITEGTTGGYATKKFIPFAAKTAVKAKFTSTGTDATAGSADIYLFVVRIPA